MRIIMFILVLTLFKLLLLSMVYHSILLLIRGYSTMLGYWDDKEKTDEVRVHVYRALRNNRFCVLR